jgi:hypothetical protein
VTVSVQAQLGVEGDVAAMVVGKEASLRSEIQRTGRPSLRAA